jgi:hypothetical protein
VQQVPERHSVQTLLSRECHSGGQKCHNLFN